MTTITPENPDTFDTTYVTVIASTRRTEAVRYATRAQLQGVGDREAESGDQSPHHGSTPRRGAAPEPDLDVAYGPWGISTGVLDV